MPDDVLNEGLRAHLFNDCAHVDHPFDHLDRAIWTNHFLPTFDNARKHDGEVLERVHAEVVNR